MPDLYASEQAENSPPRLAEALGLQVQATAANLGRQQDQQKTQSALRRPPDSAEAVSLAPLFGSDRCTWN